MELPTYFADFLREIRPTKSQRDDYRQGHQTLQDRLNADERLAPKIINTFLQGSYRRATAVRPTGDRRPDVDVIVVTNLREADYTPSEAMELFRPFLQKHYKGKYHYQGRSIAIELSYVALDLVVTSAASEAVAGVFRSEAVKRLAVPEDVDEIRELMELVEAVQKTADWKLVPLRIPDREAERWEDTHPLEQIRWTVEKNKRCSGHYVNVVKALKWWRRTNPDMPKYPKSYPFEHLIGSVCPDEMTSIAHEVTSSFELIAKLTFKPYLPDHGVPMHDVLHRVTDEDFAAFLEQVRPAAELARQALDETDLCESARLWKQLFGDRFPDPPEGTCDEDDTIGGFSERKELSKVDRTRFA